MLETDNIRVSSIQRLCVHDGPGVRTTVFLKGCYLKCPWCCNPEAISYHDDCYYDKGNCLNNAKLSICQECEQLGGSHDKTLCPFDAFERTYADYPLDKLKDEILQKHIVEKQYGGITFSGGEPLLQARQLRPLLKMLKAEGMHIAFETSLYAPQKHFLMVKDYVDYWLVDLKFQFGFIINPEFKNEEGSFATNLSILQNEGLNVEYRMVVLKQIVNKLDSIIVRLKNNRIRNLTLLQYHSLAQNKYKELRKPFIIFDTPSTDDLHKTCLRLSQYDVKCKYLTV